MADRSLVTYGAIKASVPLLPQVLHQWPIDPTYDSYSKPTSCWSLSIGHKDLPSAVMALGQLPACHQYGISALVNYDSWPYRLRHAGNCYSGN